MPERKERMKEERERHMVQLLSFCKPGVHSLTHKHTHTHTPDTIGDINILWAI